MQINVRLNGALATQAGRVRLTLELPAGATVADLVRLLGQTAPGVVAEGQRAVAVISGSHVSLEQTLRDGQEVALLLPIAGGMMDSWRR